MSQYTGLENARILVVEDVELNQYLARHIMESWGCVVEVVENGSVAVERLSTSNYDLVLMDIQMPVMDGIQATKLIRGMEDDFKSKIPIVALTANAMKSECETYLEAGMNDWLGKPFQEPALFKTVSRNIRKQNNMTSGLAAVPVSEQAPPVRKNKLYDLAMIESISGGDKAFIQRMLNLFLETVPATLQDLKTSADRGEWMAASKLAHKLKSTIDSMGVAQLKQVIREVESGGKTGGDPEALRSKVAQVISTMELVMTQVKQELREG